MEVAILRIWLNRCDKTPFYELKINLYPNPTNGNLIISGTLSQPQLVDISVVNLLGEMVTKNQFQAGRNWQTTIDLNAEAAGIYLVTIRTDKGNIVKRVLVE